MKLSQIQRNYRKNIFRLLGHRQPRKFVIRHPWKFVKILTACSEEKIHKRLSSCFFNNLKLDKRESIIGKPLINYKIPELTEINSGIKSYIHQIKQAPITFSQNQQITFTIIIPVYEQFEMTCDCLRSLSHLYSARTDLEIIIADDSKTTNYQENLSNLNARGVKISPNTTGVSGFLPNCNQASNESNGDYIIFLNNDTIILPNWLEGIERHLSDKNKIVGSKLIYLDGALQEAGGGIFSDGSAINIGKLNQNDHPFYNFSRISDYISGASLCVERAWFQSSGMFDTRYSPAYYEDTDLCVRAKDEGYNVIYSSESKVIHLEGKSCGNDETDESSIKHFQAINKEKFLKKWDLSSYLSPKHKFNDHALIHKRQTILVVCPYDVRTNQDSGRKRMYFIISILQTFYDVVVYASPDVNRSETSSHWVRDLNLKGIEVITRDTHNNLEALLADRQFELVWVSWLISAESFSKHAHYLKNYKWIYDTVDLHFLREARKNNLSLENTAAIKAQTCFNKEINLLKKADKVIVVSSFEQNLLQDQFSIDSEVLGNIEKHISRSSTPFESKQNTIAFVGSFLHEPNVTSMELFLKTHWNKIVDLVPDITLKIIGNKADEYKKTWRKYPNIEIPGWVECVNEHIADCKLTIAPLLHGAGVKGKINQSLANGIPVLATPVAGEGMLDPSGDNCGIIIREFNEFSDSLKKILPDKLLLEKESQQGLKWVQELCGYDPAQQLIQSILKNLN